MAYGKAFVALAAIVAAPLSAAAYQPDSGPIEDSGPATSVAPPGDASTRYCLRVEVTGNIVDPVHCWTRDQWADQGVDVDKEWAEEGVGIKA